MNFIGSVRYVREAYPLPGRNRDWEITPYTGQVSSLVYSRAVRQPFGKSPATPPQTECSIDSSQVFVCHHLHLHDDHRRRPGGDLLGPTPQWVYLHMGCRKCRPQIRQILWFYSRLVVLDRLDDILRW